MRSRTDRLWLLPAGAALVFCAALLWSWIAGHVVSASSVAMRAPDRAGKPVAVAPPDSRDAGREPTRARRIWSATGYPGPGLFDRRMPEVVTAAVESGHRQRDLELVATRDLPFRLQLIGHFGAGKNLSGIFEAQEVSGPLIARSGEELEELAVTIEALEPEDAPGEESPARILARIRDRRSGRVVILRESVLTSSGIGAALLAPAGYPGEAIELLAGEILEVGGSEFRVERVGLAPASATLRRLAVAVPGEDGDELVLQVEEAPES